MIIAEILSYFIMATSFSSGRSRSTRREPPTMGKQLVNFITCDCESSAPFFVIYKASIICVCKGDAILFLLLMDIYWKRRRKYQTTFISISMSLKSFSIGYILLNFLKFIYQQYYYSYMYLFCCFVEIKKYPSY
jgi:hypothetical protein